MENVINKLEKSNYSNASPAFFKKNKIKLFSFVYLFCCYYFVTLFLIFYLGYISYFSFSHL